MYKYVYIYIPVFKNVAIWKHIFNMYTLYFVVKKVMDNAGMLYVEGTTSFYYGAKMIEKKLGNFDSSYLKAFLLAL